MSTYVISDPHGALDELQRMLDKIGFRMDGSDELYLLGDYCDWGAEPLDTLRFCMAMDLASPYVHCLMGNHEWMFLNTILTIRPGLPYDEASTIWLKNNHGDHTWQQYLALSDSERAAIRDWLMFLPYSAECTVNGVHYLMSHAYPYFSDMKYTPEEEARCRKDAVWRRLMIREDPFGFYEGRKHYDHFICGHTITEYYYYMLRFEKRWPYRKPDPSVRNRIFRAERFTDIDCGAKCFNYPEDVSETLRHGAERAQLACLRLEDGHEFYVHPVRHRGVSVRLPEVRFRGNLQNVRIPELHLGQTLQGMQDTLTHYWEEEFYDGSGRY